MKHVVAVRPRNWFDVEIERDIVSWREGLKVADLHPTADHAKAIFRIGGRIAEPDEDVLPGDVVMCIESPGDPVSAVTWLFTKAIEIAIYAAVGALVSKLIGKPDPPKAIGDDSKPSESFTFGGTRTLYSGVGVPLPVIYGERAVGGIVIGQRVVATGSPQPQQFLTLTLALSWGEVESIAGITEDRDNIAGSKLPKSILINENPITEYEGVELDVRMGTPDQEPIPGAPTTAVISEIGLPLTNNHIDDGLAAVTDWTNAVTYTMPEAGDGVLLNFGFPLGLYKQGGASLLAEKVELQIRYRALDGGGSPTGDYFPGGSASPEDGIAFDVERALLSPFSESFFLPLYDPALGPALLVPEGIFFNSFISSGVTQGYNAGSDLDTTWPLEGQNVEKLSIEMWVQLTGSNVSGVFESVLMHITDDLAGALNSFQGQDPDANAGPAAFTGLGIYDRSVGQNKVIGFYWGDGVGLGEDTGWVRCEASDFIVDCPEGTFLPDDYQEQVNGQTSGFNEKVQVFITYERDFDGSGNNRGRIYMNGTLQAETISTIEFKWPANADLPAASTGAGPVVINSVGGQGIRFKVYSGRRIYDRVVIYNDVIESDAIFFKYSSASIPDLANEDVEAWWEMDTPDVQDIGGSQQRLLDRSGNGHSMRFYNSSTGGTFQYYTASFGPNLGAGAGWSSGDWPDSTIGGSLGIGNVRGLTGSAQPFAGSPLRGRYAIEVQRVDLVENADDLADKVELSTASVISTTEFSYPKVAVVSIRLPAQDQLSNLRPNISIPVRGLRVNVWDGVDEDAPVFNKIWTRNNAWIALDMLTNPLVGLDQFFSIDQSPVLPKFLAWAEHCAFNVSNQSEVWSPAPSGSGYVTEMRWVAGVPNRLIFTVTNVNSDPAVKAVPVGWNNSTTQVTVSGIPAAQVAQGWPNDFTADLLSVDPSGNIQSIEFDLADIGNPTILDPPGPSILLPEATFTAGTAVEPRHEADVVLDAENQSAWDAIVQVAHAGRASLFRVGNRVSVAIQNIREPVQMFSDANIIPGTLTTSSIAADEEFNSVGYTFPNRNKQYRSDSLPVDDTGLNNASTDRRVTRALSSSVVTRPSEIRRAGRFAINANQLTRQWVEFETLAEALAVEPGDVFLLSAARPALGFAGRLPAIAGGTTFTLDVPVTLQPTESYKAALQTQDGSIFVANVVTAAGSYEAGDTITLDAVITSGGGGVALADAHWAIGSTDEVTREFQVVAVEMTIDLRFKIRAAAYYDEVYDETGFPDLPDESGSELYDPSEVSMPPPLQSVAVEEAAGPSSFGTSGSEGLLVSVQRAPSDNLSAAAGDVQVFARRASGGGVGQPLPWSAVGTIPAGSNLGTFPLPGGSWAPGDVVEVAASHRGLAGASLGPLRARKARVVLTGRGPAPSAPRGLEARQTGTSVLYRVTEPTSTERARPVRTEVRAGGWKLGQHIATLVPGEWSRPTDAWLSLPTSSQSRTAPKLVVRHEYANGQFSEAIVSRPTFTAPGTTLKEDSFEDGPWNSVTGDSGSVALSELENETQIDGDEVLRFTDASTSTVGTWTSPEYDLGSRQQVAVFWYIEGSQIHPISLQEFTEPFSGRGPVRDWSVEGPLSDYPDIPTQYQGDVELTLEIAFSDTATPGTDWQEYRPGLYTGRSFAFRISIERPSEDWNVEVWRGAFRITEPAQVVTFGGSF